jgi:hypothetical protein
LQRTIIMNARVPENDEGNGNEPVPPTANDLANAFRTLLGDREMRALLRTAMNSSPEPLQTPPPRRTPSPPPTPRLSRQIPLTESSQKWRPEDIGYFDPGLPESYGQGEIITVGNSIYYRNVYLFVDKIKDTIKQKGIPSVSQNLSTCL